MARTKSAVGSLIRTWGRTVGSAISGRRDIWTDLCHSATVAECQVPVREPAGALPRLRVNGRHLKSSLVQKWAERSIEFA